MGNGGAIGVGATTKRQRKRTVYRDYASLERFFVITEEWLSTHRQIALDMAGEPRKSNWPRRVFTTFKWQVKEILRGKRTVIPDAMWNEVAAVMSGEMDDPGGMRIIVDSETIRKFVDLYRRLRGERFTNEVPGLGMGDRDNGNGWTAADAERRR